MARSVPMGAVAIWRALFVAVLSTVCFMAALAEDCSGDDGDNGDDSDNKCCDTSEKKCHTYSNNPANCFHGNGTRVWDACKKTCGTCAAEQPDRELPEGKLLTGRLTDSSGQVFMLDAGANKSYVVTVSVVEGQANLQDSKMYLYDNRDCAHDMTGSSCKFIKYNDDSQGPDQGGHHARNLGSAIMWTCHTAGVYYVRVDSVTPNSDHGYFMIEMRELPPGSDTERCNDGTLSPGEEGVDCGGNCAPCTIPIIFSFDRALDISTDEDSDGVPDAFTRLRHDVEDALPANFYARIKPLVQSLPGGGVQTGGWVTSPPGMSGLISKRELIGRINGELTCSGAGTEHCPSRLKADFPHLVKVSKGELCATDFGGVRACLFGTCIRDSDSLSSMLCACDTGYEYKGQSCALKHSHPDDVVPDEKGWHTAVVALAIGFVLALGALFFVHTHYKTERKKYNQSVFEMLQAPESYAGPEVGFVRMENSSTRLPPPSPGMDTHNDSGYMPDNSFVTGGF